MFVSAPICTRRVLKLSPRRFPDLPQWAVDAVNRVVIRDWQSRDDTIGICPLARQTAKQVPLPPVRVSAHHAKIRTRADLVMPDTRGTEHNISGATHDDLPAFSAEWQFCSAIIYSEHFVRCAVIMSKGIHAVSPGISPVVLSKSALENRRAILRVHGDRAPIQ